MNQVTYLEAIRQAITDEMIDDDRVFCIGEDIGHFGGAFKVTAGLLEISGQSAGVTPADKFLPSQLHNTKALRAGQLALVVSSFVQV
ncbi:MAG: hypothetical protein AAF449_16055, partial [Myxococcota bacterium]